MEMKLELFSPEIVSFLEKSLFRVYGKIAISAQIDRWIMKDGPLYTGGFCYIID